MKICLIIPVYNNPTTICGVVHDCLRLTKLNILIVDDGSTPSVSSLLQNSDKFSISDPSRLQVITHHMNLGKGAALKTGFSFAIDHGFSHALTIDGDGQHHAEDLSSMIESAEQNPSQLVIGERQMNAKNSPLLSRIGRKCSNAWVIFCAGQPPGDSQSGMRLYPLDKLKKLVLSKQRYDFEMEILLKLLQSGTRCLSVRIGVSYPPRKLRVSHFRLLTDNLRIIQLCLELLLERRAFRPLLMLFTMQRK